MSGIVFPDSKWLKSTQTVKRPWSSKSERAAACREGFHQSGEPTGWKSAVRDVFFSAQITGSKTLLFQTCDAVIDHVRVAAEIDDIRLRAEGQGLKGVLDMPRKKGPGSLSYSTIPKTEPDPLLRCQVKTRYDRLTR